MIARSLRPSARRKRGRGTNGTTTKAVGPTVELGGFSTTLLSAFVVLLGFCLSQLWIFAVQPECMSIELTASIANVVEKSPPDPPQEPMKVQKASAKTPQAQHGVVLGALTPPKEPPKEELEFPPTAKFPPQCTASQYESLAQQLPPERCEEVVEKPWAGGCSFSEKTVCGNANPHWLYDFVKEKESFKGIIVGCNKGFDALQILTSISANKSYNAEEWGKEFSKIPETAEIDSTIECPDQSKHKNNPGVMKDIHLYCIDGAPNTVKQLQKTKQALGYGDELTIIHSIIYDTHHSDGLSVKVTDPIGYMGSGTKHWRNECRKKPEQCEAAPTTNIDTFVKSTPALAEAPLIQYLKVSAVGSDYFTLKGAARTLERIQYIDFGYHWNFEWGSTYLKDLIHRLKKKGFVCYLTGTGGEALWRVTNCWRDLYDKKFPASLGCVNANIPEAEPLLNKMEELFQKTLAQS